VALLVCLPPSGAGRSFFRSWPRRLDGAAVLALSRPGHEERLREPLAGSLLQVAADVAARVLAREPDRVVLFGHSLGASAAFEAARLLAGAGPEVALVVSARQAPQLAGRAAAVVGRGDDELLATVSGWGGGAPAGPVRDLLLPLLRADLRLSAGYGWDGGRLDLPLTAISYRDDVVVDAADVRAWTAATSGRVTHVELPGDHFAARQPPPSLIDVLGQVLAGREPAQPGG
jgi:surfactin synthase thioesterase subunit